MHHWTGWDSRGDAQRNTLAEDVKVIGIWVMTDHSQTVPEVETKGLTVLNRQKLLTDGVVRDLQVPSQICQKRFQLVLRRPKTPERRPCDPKGKRAIMSTELGQKDQAL